MTLCPLNEGIVVVPQEDVTSAMIEAGFAVCDRAQIDEWIAISYHTF